MKTKELTGSQIGVRMAYTSGVPLGRSGLWEPAPLRRPAFISHLLSSIHTPGKSGQPVKLPPQPTKLLIFLTSRRGELVTREEIKESLWGADTFVDFEQGLNFCIKKIRFALGDNPDQPEFIQTLPRRGYRFIGSG